MKKLFFSLFLVSLCCVPCFADELPTVEPGITDNVATVDPDITDNLATVEPDIQEDVPTVVNVPNVLQIDKPVEVVPVPVEDYEVSRASVSGSIYNGSFNSTAYNYFSGIMLKNLKTDYVSFRSDRYTYDLFYGDGLTYDNGTFSGTNLNHVRYNTESSYNYLTYDNQDLNIRVNNGFCYSNLGVSYGSFTEVQTAKILYLSCILSVVLLGFLFTRWIFAR